MARANRVAFLVDASNYFAAFRQAVLAARQSVLILGWDVDSRVRLLPADEPGDGYPPTLLAFLNAVLADRPDLHVHVLGWDFSMIYTFEREMLPSYKFGWRGHRRLHFALDGEHPLYASHHQKVVVVDDRLAFCGGLDLTIRRWDTEDHAGHDARRVDPVGLPYGPVHDVQMMVDGEAAAALGTLARGRWQVATGELIEAPAPITHRENGPPVSQVDDPWPQAVPVDLAPAEVGIARTASDAVRGAHIQEILALTLRAIAEAKRTIFVENQYLTSGAVGEALACRLAEPDGPEVILVLPRLESGWLEQSSMGILRGRLLARLRQADRHGRLHLFYPVVPDLGRRCLNVHSKLLITDERLLKLGSANLSNRSMGLDSECDLAIEATEHPADAPVAAAIAGFRSRLLAEHLGVSRALVDERVRELGVAGAITSLRGGARSLEPLEDEGTPFVNLAVLDGLVCDPERPIAPEQLIDEFVPDHAKTPAQRAVAGLATVLGVLLVLVVLWRISPLVPWLGLGELAPWVKWLREHPVAPLVALAAFMVGALVHFPATLLIGAMVLLYRWPRGVIFAWSASLAAAAVGYWVGRLMRKSNVRRRWAAQTMWLRGQLRRRGFLAVAVARLVPVGDFTAMNMVAGSLRVSFARFMIGNAVGLLPGILAMSLFTNRAATALREPRALNVALLVALVIAFAWALAWLGRHLARSAPPARPPVAIARGSS